MRTQSDDLHAQIASLTSQNNASEDRVAAADERNSKIQAELDTVKQDDSKRIADLNSLDLKIAELEKADTALASDIGLMQSGTMKTQAAYLAQISALNQEKAGLQEKIQELTRQQATLEILAQREEKDLDERIIQLKSAFSQEIARGDIDVRRFRDILIVSVKDAILFPPDSATLRPETVTLLKGLAEVFKSAPDRVVRIEGNTAVASSNPETLKQFPTSWHLGAARAANVAEFLQEKCGMDPLQLVATSLGEFRPRADNSTEAGKAQNRRVDFVLIARSVYEIDQLKTVLQ